MLHKYRKTVLIEAEQYRGTVKQQRKYGILRVQKPLLIAPKDYLITIEGKMIVKIGDYIATDVDGEYWAIDQDIFERTYERVD